jgi:hypothetical protein
MTKDTSSSSTPAQVLTPEAATEELRALVGSVAKKGWLEYSGVPNPHENHQDRARAEKSMLADRAFLAREILDLVTKGADPKADLQHMESERQVAGGEQQAFYRQRDQYAQDDERRRLRAADRHADREGASLSGAAGAHHCRLCSGRLT